MLIRIVLSIVLSAILFPLFAIATLYVADMHTDITPQTYEQCVYLKVRCF